MSPSVEIKPKSLWICRKTGQVARVMGEAEGWIVARWKGCMPWLVHRNEWLRRFEPMPKDAPR